MYLDELNNQIEAIVELVRPEIKGEIHKKLIELRNATTNKTIEEFQKGMNSLILHMGKHIDRPVKEKEEEKLKEEDKPSS